MDIVLYQNVSEIESIHKTLTNDTTFSGYLREPSSVINPSFNIETTNPSMFNYCYIEAFGRYYFITNITCIRTGIWRIDCDVDVLMSYAQQILNLDVIISDNTSPDNESYMTGDQWKSLVKTKTDVLNFPYGLLDSGEYILITSGGVAS